MIQFDAQSSKSLDTQTKDDHLLIDLLKQSNDQVFDFIFEKYYPGLCAYANKLTNNDSQFEDLVQDVFVRLWQNRKDLNIKTSIKSYLLRSVHNACMDYFSHLKVKEQFIKYQSGLMPDVKDPSFLVEKELKDKLEDAIESLPEDLCIVFRMNRFEDVSYRQIAERLGISVKTVEFRMSKALNILRVYLHEFLILALFFNILI